MKIQNKQKLKEILTKELHLVYVYTLFFALFFFALALYKSLILGEYGISYFHLGYSLVEALVLAKIIIIGQHFHLGERYADKSLIIPTLYKTVIFTLFTFLFSILEHISEGLLRGHSFKQIYTALMNSGMDTILAKALVLFLVFSLFFAFVEMGRVMGMQKLVNLFIRRY